MTPPSLASCDPPTFSNTSKKKNRKNPHPNGTIGAKGVFEKVHSEELSIHTCYLTENTSVGHPPGKKSKRCKDNRDIKIEDRKKKAE